jgi:methionine-S-sulfoxide reductase
VVNTRVGYAGGNTRSPTYENIGNHSETIQIEYDPAQISYSELLDIFWDSHDATRNPFSNQYRSAIFYHSEEQKRLALESKAREEAGAGGKDRIKTEIISATGFYLAEAYHQKFYLRLQDDIANEFRAIYPDVTDFINSTAVARANGYVHGNDAEEALKSGISDLGLSPEGTERLLDIINRQVQSR